MSITIMKSGPMFRTRVDNGVTTVSPTSSSSYRLETYLSDTVRRARPRGAALLGAQTQRSAYTRYTQVGYYRRSGVDWSIEAPADEYLSSVGALVSNDPTNEATLRLRAALKDQNINLAQSLGEYKQTASMFSSIAGDVVSTYRSIRGGLPSLFSSGFNRLLKSRDPAAKRAADKWLGYQYGILPTLSDFHGACELLISHIQNGSLQSCRVSGYASLNGQDYSDPTWLTRKQTGRQKWSAKAYYKVTDPSLRTLTQLGFTNPLALAWELIPYSFCFDWLIDVGGYLSSLDALNGLSLVGGYLSHKDEFTVTVTYFGGLASTSNKVYVRTPFSVPLPTYPRYKPSESFKSIINGVALLTQLRFK